MDTNMNYDTIPTVDGKLLVAGTQVTWAGYDWVVADVDNFNRGVMYLILDNVYSIIKFGNASVYTNSKLAYAAADFQRTLPNGALPMLADVAIEGSTSKVFVPSLRMIDGGFQWFRNITNRIATYDGKATAWWTSSSVTGSCYACYVYTDGIAYGDGYVGNSYGFRPCVAVKLRPDTVGITDCKFGTSKAIPDKLTKVDTTKGEPALIIHDEDGNTIGVLGIYRTSKLQVFEDIRMHGDLGHTEHVRDLPEISKMPMGYELVKGMACTALTEFLYRTGRILDLGENYGNVKCNIGGKMQTIWANNTLEKFACEVVNYLAVPHE